MAISVELPETTKLELAIEDDGDGLEWDQAVWGDPAIVSSSGEKVDLTTVAVWDEPPDLSPEQAAWQEVVWALTTSAEFRFNF